MKTRVMITGVILALVLALVQITGALAVPPNPNSFYGTVKLSGANIPVGWVVTAVCGGSTYASSSYMTWNGDTVYAFNVPGDDLSTTGVVEGCTAGQTVVFMIGSIVADQTWIWTGGTNVNLDLTASDPTAADLVISGNVGIAGATITYTGTENGSTSADEFGNYSFEVSLGWVGTVTPSFPGYTFSPAQITYVNLMYNQSNQNFTAALENPPVLPSSFYCSVKSNGANLPFGIEVTARINGHIYASSPYLLYNGETVYNLNVPGDDPSTIDAVEGGVNGDTVVFFVDNNQADQTATWDSGGNTNINLTVALTENYHIYLPLVIR